MSDTRVEAIAAQHFPVNADQSDIGPAAFCMDCDQLWRCDAAYLLTLARSLAEALDGALHYPELYPVCDGCAHPKCVIVRGEFDFAFTTLASPDVQALLKGEQR